MSVKKVVPWAFLLSAVISIAAWGVIGLELLRGKYDFEAFVYIFGGCLIVMFVCLMYRNFANGKCPHCGKPKQAGGKYCPHCGKEIKKIKQ